MFVCGRPFPVVFVVGPALLLPSHWSCWTGNEGSLRALSDWPFSIVNDFTHLMWHLFIFHFYPFSSPTNRLTNAGCQTYCWLKNTEPKQNFTASSKHKLLNEIHSGVKMIAYFVLFVSGYSFDCKYKVLRRLFPLTLVQNIHAGQWSAGCQL